MARKRLASAEASVLESLTQSERVWGSFFELTPTQLAKSTIDATAGLRDAFAKSGLHSYTDQGRGRKHRATRPAHLFVQLRAVSGEVGFLRPNSGNGDPRFWIPALRGVNEVWAFGDHIGCLTNGRSLVLVNLTAGDFDASEVRRILENPASSLSREQIDRPEIEFEVETEMEDDQMSNSDLINVTPSPQILEMITFAPLGWLDGVSELIDNSIDGFAAAVRQGHKIEHPVIEIFIPKKADVENGIGRVMIRDNGPGLTKEELNRALTAGTSGNQRYGAMGLFGVGFNISTGKLGSVTKVSSRKIGSDRVITATIDLRNMRERQSYDVPLTDESINDVKFHTRHGTVVEVSEWWPKGHPNAEYPLTVAQQSQRIVLEQLGRRYATVLRGDTAIGPVTFLVYPDERSQIPDQVEPFEHCVWGENREVRRREGNVPARIQFDEILQTRRRCLRCQVQIASPDEVRCASCGSDQISSIEERIRGWVGIQRFDDADDYGIDLIRNGRLISRSEKIAFFHWTDPSDGVNRREYPVDDQTGRIVGEVHLDHVPVDYNKQHFESISTEWFAAIEFLRGKALRPKSWPDGYKNESPIARLHSAYKRIRNFGREDMYMGRWVDGQFKRVTREFEREMRERFANREDGYFDDREWWKHVELGDSIPSVHKECPHCASEYLHSPERCPNCDGVLLGKPCKECAAQIALSDRTCGSCGADQTDDTLAPWNCAYCSTSNPPELSACTKCGRAAGAGHPTDPDLLAQMGQLSDEYSRSSITVKLPDGRRSDVLELEVFFTSAPLEPVFGGPRVPLVSDSSKLGGLQIFMDETFPLILSDVVTREFLISVEVANYFRSRYGEMTQSKAHTVSALASALLDEYWPSGSSAGIDQLRQQLGSLFDDISERVSGSDAAVQFFQDLRPFEQQEIYDSLFKASRTGDAAELIETGRYVDIMPRQYFVKFFERFPDLWLERVFSVVLPRIDQVGEERAKRHRERLLAQWERALADCADAVDSDDLTRNEFRRAELAFDTLADVLANGN